jgi:hypothetical protein
MAMKNILTSASLAALAVGGFALIGFTASAEENRVKFPNGYESGVHYATVKRGNITEELFTSSDAIAAAKAGEALPNGTVITMTDSRDGKLYRTIVMQKGNGWGSDVPEERRTGDWQFQWFNPDKTVNVSESMGRCQSCHQSQASNDFVWTYDRMRSHP